MNSLQTLAQYCGDQLRHFAAVFELSSIPAQRIIRQFRAAGAVTAARARAFRPQSRIEEIEFLRLVRSQVICQPSPGRYFLAEDRLDDIRGNAPPPTP
jgi:hypothetical protein